MPSLLFLKPLFQRLHDLFPGTERFYLLHFLGRQIFFRHSLQPFQRYFGILDAIACFQSLEDLGKDLNSEERRGGKEWVSKCGSRGARLHYIKKTCNKCVYAT